MINSFNDIKKFLLDKNSKNYLNHLFNTNEILASMILTLQNINFYQELMTAIRESIKKGTLYNFTINILTSCNLRQFVSSVERSQIIY